MTDTSLITPLQNNLVKEYLQIEYMSKNSVKSPQKSFYKVMVNSSSSVQKFQLDQKYQNNEFQLLNRTNILKPSIRQKRVQKNPFYAFQVFRRNLMDNIIKEEQKKQLQSEKDQLGSWDGIELQEQPDNVIYQKNAFNIHVHQNISLNKKKENIRGKLLPRTFEKCNTYKISELKLPQTVKYFNEKKKNNNSTVHAPNIPMNQYLISKEEFKKQQFNKKSNSTHFSSNGQYDDYSNQYQIFKQRVLSTKFKSNKRAEISVDPCNLSFEFRIPDKIKKNSYRIV